MQTMKMGYYLFDQIILRFRWAKCEWLIIINGYDSSGEGGILDSTFSINFVFD